MKTIMCVFGFLCLVATYLTAGEQPASAPATALPAAVSTNPAPRSRLAASNIQTSVLRSEVLGEDRHYTVYLPPGYETSKDRYPVLFLLDGPRHGKYAAGLAEYLSRYAEAIPPVIVVDIEQPHRGRDMTPTPSKENPNDTGGADRFLSFLSKEFVPHIQANYRTRSPLVLWGYSLSGLFAFHALLTQPELFDGYITASPAIWWDDSLLVRRAGEFFKTREALNRKLYFAVGADERQAVQDYFDQLNRILKERTPRGFQYAMRRFEAEAHPTICIPTTYYGLKFVFAESAKEITQAPRHEEQKEKQ